MDILKKNQDIFFCLIFANRRSENPPIIGKQLIHTFTCIIIIEQIEVQNEKI